ncbi:Rap1a/Tai family immunity protein [Kluyvera intermedia]|uniref:Rap1a/Tai family immunity protein n=1 Tax=Kluyvera intermedia TaxID=61648 RepID=UPI00372D2E76
MAAPAHTIRVVGARMISKVVYPAALLLCFSAPALAKSTLNIDGNTLYHGYQLFERGFDYLNVQDEQTAVMYMSFVAGVAGTLSQENIICNGSVTIGQKADIVGNYLQSHPKERTKYNPSELAMIALSQELPCSKK